MGVRRSRFLIPLLICWLEIASLAAAVGASPPQNSVAYLIVSNNFCIIVRSPARQISTIPGQVPLLILLKDQQTVITIQGGYLMIAVPHHQIDAAIGKYHLAKLILIE